MHDVSRSSQFTGPSDSESSVIPHCMVVLDTPWGGREAPHQAGAHPLHRSALCLGLQHTATMRWSTCVTSVTVCCRDGTPVSACATSLPVLGEVLGRAQHYVHGAIKRLLRLLVAPQPRRFGTGLAAATRCTTSTWQRFPPWQTSSATLRQARARTSPSQGTLAHYSIHC